MRYVLSAHVGQAKLVVYFSNSDITETGGNEYPHGCVMGIHLVVLVSVINVASYRFWCSVGCPLPSAASHV